MFGPTVLYNVELKSPLAGSRKLVRATGRCIEKHTLADRVLVSSFNPLTLRQCRHELRSEIVLALVRSPGLSKYGYLLARGRADHPEASLVNEQYMDWARRQDYRVHVWTVDDPELAKKLVGIGVHGVITNRPKLLGQVF
jgi:glycerophosphoryl diester phosphodiesterase